jgi:hypothetical protein
MLVAILVPIAFFIGVFTMIIFLRKYENDERMAMIEKGMNPVNTAKPKTNPSGTLRFALLAIGAGVGLLVGNTLEKANLVDDEVAYFSMVLLFGGLGLLVSYLIQLRQDQKEKRVREREIV